MSVSVVFLIYCRFSDLECVSSGSQLRATGAKSNSSKNMIKRGDVQTKMCDIELNITMLQLQMITV